MSVTRPVPLAAINELNQVRDELLVVWLALTNDQAEEHTVEISNYVGDLHLRVCDIAKKMGERAQ